MTRFVLARQNMQNERVSQKILSGTHTYCFKALELLLTFLERTHAVIGIGLPVLVVVAAHAFLGRWGTFAVLMLAIIPAGAAACKMILDGLVLTKSR
jgi:hypothetical protein